MKFYLVKTAFGEHAVGAKIELDPENAGTKGLVAVGAIEEAPAAEDAIAAKVLAAVGDQMEAAGAQLAERLSKGFAKGGPRIEVVQDEADKNRSFADWLKTVGMISISDMPQQAKAAGFERLTKVYGSKYADWGNSPAGEGFVGGAQGKAALAEGSGITGGYTVPAEYSNNLLSLAIEDTLIPSRATKFTMGERELRIPYLNQSTAPTAGQTAFTGGMVATWTSEAATRAETEPQFKQLVLVNNELSGYSLMSRNLLQDSAIAIEQVLTEQIKRTVDWYIDFACLRGDGVGKPRGIIGSGAAKTVNRASGSHIGFADVVSMYMGMYSPSINNAIWIAQTSTIAELYQIKDGSNRVLWLPNAPGGFGGAMLAQAPAATLLGRPIYFTEKLPALGTQGDLIFVDPKQYVFAPRVNLEIAASDQFKFINNQMTWRFIARLDGAPWLDAPVTLQDASTTVSPFVVLN